MRVTSWPILPHSKEELAGIAITGEIAPIWGRNAHHAGPALHGDETVPDDTQSHQYHTSAQMADLS